MIRSCFLNLVLFLPLEKPVKSKLLHMTLYIDIWSNILLIYDKYVHTYYELGHFTSTLQQK